MNDGECIFVNNNQFSDEYEDTNNWKNSGPDFEDKAFDISNRPIEFDTKLADKFSNIFNFLKYFF
jgi:hypothetical protein